MMSKTVKNALGARRHTITEQPHRSSAMTQLTEDQWRAILYPKPWFTVRPTPLEHGQVMSIPDPLAGATYVIEVGVGILEEFREVEGKRITTDLRGMNDAQIIAHWGKQERQGTSNE